MKLFGIARWVLWSRFPLSFCEKLKLVIQFIDFKLNQERRVVVMSKIDACLHEYQPLLERLSMINRKKSLCIQKKRKLKIYAIELAMLLTFWTCTYSFNITFVIAGYQLTSFLIG